jgi:hypothetical protein
MILKLWLLGCACICSSKILKPLGGKINLEGNNGILGSLFYLRKCQFPIRNEPTDIAFMPKV